MKKLICLALASSALVGAAHAINFTLTDGNSVVNGNDVSQLQDWTTDGVDHLFNQDYYWRIGNTAEQNIGAIGPMALTVIAPNIAKVSFTNAGLFQIDITYILAGGAPGSGTSDIGETVRIQNLSNGALDFHLFEYDDFDINQTAGGDFASMLNSSTVSQWEGSVTAMVGTVPIPDAWQIAAWPSIRNDLQNGTATNLNNTGSGSGPADLAFALQWDRSIAAGGTFIMSKNKRIETVPEPATMTALGLGIAAMIRRRNKK